MTNDVPGPSDRHHITLLYLKDSSSGRWHTATVVGDEEPRLMDACNAIGGREYFHELPDEPIDDKDLCRRCFQSSAAD